MESNNPNLRISEPYSKEQIDNKLSFFKDSLTKLAKAIKELKEAFNSKVLDNKAIANLIEARIDNAQEIKDYIDESIKALQRQIDEKSKIVPEETPEVKPQEKTQEKPKTEMIKAEDGKEYPKYQTDAYGVKRTFLKINRTSKEPIYQLEN